MSHLSVDVWSDIACPWCWVGKRQLEAAMRGFAGEVRVTWRAFELDPRRVRDAEEGSGDIDYAERLAVKYGTTRDQGQQMIDRMVGVGREVGLDMRFDRIRPGNTFDAHRLLAWALAEGGTAVQGELKERLFRAYLHEGVSPSDSAALAACAAGVGLDAERAAAVLAIDDHADHVRGDEYQAGSLGVTGVPFFVIEGRYAVAGAQPAEVIAGILERAESERMPSVVAAGDACGPDGCDV